MRGRSDSSGSGDESDDDPDNDEVVLAELQRLGVSATRMKDLALGKRIDDLTQHMQG